MADVESSEVKSTSQLQDSRADVESSEVKSTSQLHDSRADVESSEVKSTSQLQDGGRFTLILGYELFSLLKNLL